MYAIIYLSTSRMYSSISVLISDSSTLGFCMLQSDPFGHMTLRDFTLEACSKVVNYRAAKEAF